MKKLNPKKYINREISWLSFNERVLQESEDPKVPILERLKFLGIFSNNLDEFFRVRVATLKRMTKLEKEATRDLGENPVKILKLIKNKVFDLQKRFDQSFQTILKELEKEQIHILNEEQLNVKQTHFIRKYFREKVIQTLFPIMLDSSKRIPVLRDKSIYLAVRLINHKKEKNIYSLIEVPTGALSRFIELPREGDKRCVMFLDDIIRHNLNDIYSFFTFDEVDAYTIKVTRDAELDIDNDVSESFVELVKKSLKKRKKADPVRFIHDAQMPEEFVKFLHKKLHLKEGDTVMAGSRYHNFKDFINFPTLDRPELWYEASEQLYHSDFKEQDSLFSVMREKDVMLYYPYHSFNHMLDFLREASIDPAVTHIRMTLYRVAKNSKVIRSLINAARNGKSVTVVVELQARFDEESNIYWANKLQEEGVKVIFGITDLKIHSKLCLISRKERGEIRYYANIGTGNYNENTARVYTDFSLFTSDYDITQEVREMFDFLNNSYQVKRYHNLLVSPFYMRKELHKLINRESQNARAGKRAEIMIKVNNLVDPMIIKTLYRASKAGVKIRLIVRGICSLIPGVEKQSENIEVISIIDKYLEHPRVFVFHNNGQPEVYFGSADLMARNLDYRVEVICPVKDENIKRQMIDILEIQWQDNVKSRSLNREMTNEYRKIPEQNEIIRSQKVIHTYLKEGITGSQKVPNKGEDITNDNLRLIKKKITRKEIA